MTIGTSELGGEIMRAFYRARASRVLQEDLALVEDILFSPIFIYLDLLLLSLIFSYVLYPLHQSIVIALLLFIGFCASCIVLFYGMNKWNDGDTRK